MEAKTDRLRIPGRLMLGFNLLFLVLSVSGAIINHLSNRLGRPNLGPKLLGRQLSTFAASIERDDDYIKATYPGHFIVYEFDSRQATANQWIPMTPDVFLRKNEKAHKKTYEVKALAEASLIGKSSGFKALDIDELVTELQIKFPDFKGLRGVIMLTKSPIISTRTSLSYAALLRGVPHVLSIRRPVVDLNSVSVAEVLYAENSDKSPSPLGIIARSGMNAKGLMNNFGINGPYINEIDLTIPKDDNQVEASLMHASLYIRLYAHECPLLRRKLEKIFEILH